jgi:hypothetical protein|tara:strand:- start:11350 stop:11574 length:225 start_codon:yes stop_codon:yes gene_type:complete
MVSLVEFSRSPGQIAILRVLEVKDAILCNLGIAVVDPVKQIQSPCVGENDPVLVKVIFVSPAIAPELTVTVPVC